MQYPVLSRSPDVAGATVAHTLDGGGNAVPVAAATPLPMTAPALGALTDAAIDDYTSTAASLLAVLKGLLKVTGKQTDGIYGDGTGVAAGTFAAFFKALLTKDANVVFSSGNGTQQTNPTGATFNTLTSQACKSVTISNQTGTTLDVQQGGAGAAFQLPTGQVVVFRGLTNANNLGIRRSDASSSQVTASYRWEA